MPKTVLNSRALNDEPSPQYATDAEIALAEQLRIRIEERYLGSAAAQLATAEGPKEVH